MVQITDELIDNLAHLSRLTFNENEKESIKKDMQSMVAFVEKLNEVDTTGVEPLLFITQRANVLREDKVQGSIDRETALQNAPKTDGEFFLVPKVITQS